MPTYQYRCLHCHRRFEVFMTYQEYETSVINCPHCQSQNVQRRIGRIRIAKTEESRLESLADPGVLAGMEDDPKAMAQMMRKMSNEMGEEIGPEFDEVVDRLEAGQSPEEIEQDLPELGAEADGDFGGMGNDF